MNCYPGTIIEANSRGGEFLDGIFNATAGIVMSQLKKITGLNAPTVQNWANRGWISRPVNKKYTKDQTARILIINMLRDTMSLEDISKLLVYVNGDVNDRSDDIIPESALYALICEVLESGEPDGNYKKIIDDMAKNFDEKIPGSKSRVKEALTIITLEYKASLILGTCRKLLSGIKKSNILGRPF